MKSLSHDISPATIEGQRFVTDHQKDLRPSSHSIEQPTYSTLIVAAAADGHMVREAQSYLFNKRIRCGDLVTPVDPSRAEQAIRAGVRASRSVLVLLSKATAHDPMVVTALEHAKQQNRPVFVVPIEPVQLEMPLAPLLALEAGVEVRASGSLASHLDSLLGDLVSGIKPPVQPNHRQENEMNNGIQQRSKSSLVPWAITVVLGAAVIALTVIYVIPQYRPAPGGVPQASSPSAASLTAEQLVQKLLAAIDSEDYAAVSLYASELFDDRRDLDILAYNGKLQPPIIAAAQEGDLRLFKALADARPVFGLEDARGREAIHVAAEAGHAELVSFLINQIHINVDDPTDGTGFTPLHWAALSGRKSVIMDLILLGADVNCTTNRGKTPLHLAVENQQRASFQALIQLSQVKIDATDTNGQTPLHYAAKDGSEWFAKKLLLGDAMTSARDNEGRTPGQIAYEFGHDELAQILDFHPTN